MTNGVDDTGRTREHTNVLRHARVCVLLIFALAIRTAEAQSERVAVAQQPAGIDADVRHGRPPTDVLIDLLVFGMYAVPGESIDASAFPPDVRGHLKAQLARLRRFNSRLPKPRKPSPEIRMMHSAHVAYERRLAVVSADPRAPALAASYVQALRPCYEWEGFHHCPRDEARFAEEYLAKSPDSPFSAYLQLLAAQRWLCAAEGYEYGRQPEQAQAAKQRSQERLDVARRSPDALIRTAADALAERGRCRVPR